jgi:hypothetical protein
MSNTDFYEVAPQHDTHADKYQSGGFMICRSVEMEPISMEVLWLLTSECSRATTMHACILTEINMHPSDFI